jgi:UDP-2-acetamido-2-deoxy-ribo-hexuluronate aminotransferase
MMNPKPMHIPFVDLKAQYGQLKAQIDARIKRVLDHGQFILGPEVAELEQRLASLTGSRHCISCASGTDAMLMALIALGVGPGDEVITPSFTFIATAEVIALVGATPVFVDVEKQTCNLDATKLRSAFTTRTRAVLPVSLYGQPADMDEINAIAAEFGVPVIEDAAQSFGATYQGRWSCNLSLIGCTSFFPSKPLGCYGDGGAIFTDDDELAQAMREIRVHGQSGRYVHTRIGIGGRMDTLQCAIVLAKLDAFELEIANRLEVGQRYSRLLQSCSEQVEIVRVKPDRTSVYAQYTILVENRAAVQKALQSEGIPTAVHYPAPIHRQPAYARWAAKADCPVSEQLAEKVLSLPMHAYLDEPTQARIVATLARATASSTWPTAAIPG